MTPAGVEQFENVLAGLDSEFGGIEESLADSYPPNGDYVVTVANINRSLRKGKDEKPIPIWRLKLEVLDGEQQGENFPMIFNWNNEYSIGRLKGLVRLGTGAECPESITGADAALTECVGKAFIVRVNKRDDSDFTNVDPVKSAET